jgi:hypothetical protein
MKSISPSGYIEASQSAFNAVDIPLVVGVNTVKHKLALEIINYCLKNIKIKNFKKKDCYLQTGA